MKKWGIQFFWSAICALSINARAQELPVLAQSPLPYKMMESLGAFASQFSFSGGVRYWYSQSNNHFKFSNGFPGYGNPTSTLDWNGNTAHSGEGYVRIDHHTTRLFVKALGGGGGINGDGEMTDRDFLAGQRSFSVTRSAVNGADLSYAMLDLGINLRPVPQHMPDLTISPFIGYHYWSDNPISKGLNCETRDVAPRECFQTVLLDQSVKAVGYGIRWDVLRVGLGAAIPVALVKGLSVSAEVAWVPYAHFNVDDSHYLRVDLGPTPNSYHRGSARGVEAEVMVSYALTDRFKLGVGGRYWGLFSYDGESTFRQSQRSYSGTRFEQQRYGLLVEAKYRF
ncbi:omptin family outer membrane protease [Dankookia rubra]|nr:omptin family outer membrane protease [Dankookia rubra]